MKTNAIIRIVVWSLVIVTLLGVLTAGLGVTRILPSKTIAASPAESIAPQRIEETHVPQLVEVTLPEDADISLPSNYTVTVTTNVRSEPDPMAEVLGAVEAGQVINPTQGKQMDGHHWAYIEAPVQGWILLVDYAEESTVPTEESIPTGTVNTDEPFYAFDTANIHSISIQWAAGNITVLSTDGSQILVSETGNTAKHPMEIKQKKDKLSIEFNKKSSVGIHLDASKDLQVLVPKDMLVSELDIDAASASVLVQDLSFREVEFEGASGACEFLNCSVDKLDIDTASGDISFAGTLNALECDAASASFAGVLSNVPRTIEMESMSGNLDLTLPENAGYTVTMEGMNTKLSSDFETTTKGSAHVSGDGACRIQMEAMNGDVIIRKAK